MKTALKRTLSVLLTLLMAFSCAAVAFAEPCARGKSSNSVSVNTDNDFSKIVMSTVQAQTDNEELYGITDITVDGASAEVHLTSPDNCTLVVAIFDESGKMLGCGVEPADAQKNDYTVSLSGIVFPEYYTVKGFLLYADNSPVCSAYVGREHTRAFEAFMDLTVNDFDEEYVMNFDEDETNNFAVLREGTVMAKTSGTVNVLKSFEEATDTYVISNADSVVKGLKSGDVLFLKTGKANADYIIVKVKSLSVSGKEVTIVSDEETVDGVFDCIKIDSAGGMTDENVRNAELGSALTLDETPTVRKAKADVDIESSMNKSIATKLEYKNEEDTASASGSLTFSFNAYIKIYYDVKIFKEDYFEYRFSHDEKLEFKGEVKGKAAIDKEETKIGVDDIPIAGTPITVSVNVFPIVEFNISLNFTISCTSKFTQTYNPYDGHREIQEKDKDFDADLSTNLEIKFGMGLAVEFKAVKVLSLEVSAKVALVLKGELDGNLKCLLDKYHYCDLCIEGDIKVTAGIELNVKVKITKKLTWNLLNWKIVEASVKLCDFYYSKINGISMLGFSQCPHKLYKVTYSVIASDGGTKFPAAGATLELGEGRTDSDGDGTLDASSAIAAEDGKAFAYFKEGDHSVKITLSGFIDETVHFLVDGSTPEQKVTLIRRTVNPPTPDPDDPDNPDAPGGTDDFDGDITQCNVGDIIQYGSYPQSRVTDTATLRLLDPKAQAGNWTAYPYYISGTQTEYMYYLDVKLGTQTYRGVRFDRYRPYYTGGSSSEDNSCQYDNGYRPGVVYWFRYEPLQWRVLDPATGLVLCETIIDSQDFHHTTDNHANGKYANNWGESDIRTFLNTSFMNTAFNGAEQQAILSTNLDTPCPGNSTYSAGKTTDRVFLLSYYDVINPAYGFAGIAAYDYARETQGSDYAKCQGLYLPTNSIYSRESCWCLRSPLADSYATYYVNYDGSAGRGYHTYITYYGVRPALRLNLGSVTDQPDAPGSDTDFDGDITDCNVGDIIQYGAYPQSRVTDSATLQLLEPKAQAGNWTAYPYYISGTQTEYMYYLDVKLGTQYYRGVKFNQYRPYYTSETSSADYSYQDDNGYKTDVIYWFRYEPLQWRVLDPATGFVLCESIIDAQEFHHTTDDHPNGKYANNWGESDIRTFLNTTFMNTAFNGIERQTILSTELDSPCPTDNSYSAGKTTDKSFLLSYHDAINPAYGFSNFAGASDNIARCAQGTDYAKCQGLFVPSYGGGNSYWFLRSPTADSVNAFCVEDDGYISKFYTTCCTPIGVRPALRLNLGSVAAQSETGSVHSAGETGERRTVSAGQTYTASQSSVVPGEEYVLLVRAADAGALTADTLWYIDQKTADSAEIGFNYVPSHSGECTVEIIGRRAAPVEPEPQSRLTGVTCSGGTLVYKKSMTLAPTVQTDGDVQYTLTYSSSNPKIAEVDRNGSITTRKSGTVTVTVTATNNADPADTVETTCTITVKYAWWQWIIRILLLGFIWY